MRITLRDCLFPSFYRQIRSATLAKTAKGGNRQFNMSGSSQQLTIERSIKDLPPSLDQNKHKGQAGRIGIIGGSVEYTGAPYFAAMTALRCGADLAYIFCKKRAATAIKSYAPELIVLPFLDDESNRDLITGRLANLHSLVIGPGLGDDTQVHLLIRDVITYIKTSEKIRCRVSLVFDADAIDFLVNNKEVLLDYSGPVYLTPNINELRKLTNAYLGIQDPAADDAALQMLARCVNENATLIVKGRLDKIVTGGKVYECSVEGSSRRVGGQGDLLSGSLGLFSYWATLPRICTSLGSENVPSQVLAAYSACAITRLCSRFAYLKKGRSMITSDMIDEVQNAYDACFNQ